MTHMAPAEQRHRRADTPQTGLQDVNVSRAHELKPQMHLATTTLAQRRAQGKAQHRLAVHARQTLAGLRDGLKLQVAAANRAHRGIRKDGHPGTVFTRHRTARGTHRDQHGVPTGQADQQFFGVSHKPLPSPNKN